MLGDQLVSALGFAVSVGRFGLMFLEVSLSVV